MNALMASLDSNRVELARHVLTCGADINARLTPLLLTPLLLAIKLKKVALAHALIDFGADVSISGKNGESPLLLARRLHLPDIAEHIEHIQRRRALKAASDSAAPAPTLSVSDAAAATDGDVATSEIEIDIDLVEGDKIVMGV